MGKKEFSGTMKKIRTQPGFLAFGFSDCLISHSVIWHQVRMTSNCSLTA